MKLVSAIITTHNRKSLLAKAINSVLTQTYSKIELIVVDDASDDGTDLMCLSLPLKYIYIPKEESCGGNHARNIGIMNAMGYYVAFWMMTINGYLKNRKANTFDGKRRL